MSLNRKAVPKTKYGLLLASPSKPTLDSLILLFNQGKYVDVMNKAIGLEKKFPNSFMISNILGAAYKGLGKLDKAESSFRKACELNPSNSDTFNNLGFVLSEQGKIDEATVCYKKVLKLSPNDCESYVTLGNLLLLKNNFGESMEAYNRALTIKPDFAEAYNNLGNALKAQGVLDKAKEAYAQAIKLQPNFADALYNLSLLRLKNGEWESGWKGFEYRFDVSKEVSDKFISKKPLWDGLCVESLFVWAEAGIGDEVMYASCIDELWDYTDHLIVSCDSRLLPIFSRSFHQSITFVEKVSCMADEWFDSQISIGSAFGYLRQTDESFEARKEPYLKVDDNKRDYLRKKLKAVSNSRKIVGISWRSSASKDAENRSLDLLDLVNSIPDEFCLVNLQYGDVVAEISRVEESTGREIICFDDIDNFNDLDDFCALIQACDFVISIDNSTVHFAGAVGTECHVLLPFSHQSDWRWGLNGTPDSYHYRDMHLYWQSEPNCWQTCLSNLQKKSASYVF